MTGRSCDICLNRLAVYFARHTKKPETWVVCGSCRNQGIKHRSDVEYTAMPRA